METMTFRRITQLPGTFRILLDKKPADYSKVRVQMIYPRATNGRKVKGIFVYQTVKTELREDAGRVLVILPMVEMMKALETQGVKHNWDVIIDVRYPVK
jgi:hypothetical protein